MATICSCVASGQQVAGELLDQELVVGHVAVERVDHPVAPRPLLARQVLLVAVACRRSGRRRASAGPLLAVVRRREQPIDQLARTRRRRVRDERIDFLRRRRQADQVERKAGGRSVASVGLGRRLRTSPPPAGEDERVDRRCAAQPRVARPAAPPAAAARRTPSAPRYSPPADPPLAASRPAPASAACCAFGGGITSSGSVLVIARDQLALVRLARHDGGLATRRRSAPRRAGRAAGSPLRAFVVGAVAGEAVVRQDRPHVAVVVHLTRRLGREQAGGRRDGEQGGDDTGTEVWHGEQ